jgi:cytochrome b6-f complex iron-sulfur subunit
MLVDDLRMELTPEELSRRGFLGLVGSGCMAVLCLGSTAAVGQYMWPNVLFEEPSKVVLMRPEDVEPGSITAFPSKKVFLVRSQDGFYAFTSVCTHLGCVTNYDKAQGKILCPCHGSQFDLTGRVVGGPAPRPLPRLELTLEKGTLVVDTRVFVAPDWVLKV